MGAFGLFNGENRHYPPFAANISIEVFEDKTKQYWLRKNDSYVRLKYNGKAQKLLGCSKSGSHYLGDPTLCTYEAFMSTMKPLIPGDFASECAI